MEIIEEQIQICKKYNVDFIESPLDFKVGINTNVKDLNLFPINGLRHTPQGDTTGWYIWSGDEFNEDPDFFVPLHTEHLKEWRPEIIKFLALPPGYRFLIGENNYEDVWFDEKLIIL